MTVLAPAFFITAMFYAMVGFGGGSTYNALLAIAETDYRLMPTIALLCNLVVVSGGTWRFAKEGHFSLRRITPWIVTSIPAAWLGGYIEIPERTFIALLGISLLLAGLQILRKPSRVGTILPEIPATAPVLMPLVFGGLLGLLAGMVGIGGGIFLAPVLYLIRWDGARAIAAACSFFIFVNSFAGLAGQLMKLGQLELLSNIGGYWLVFPAVLVGGQIGSFLGARSLDPKILRLATGFLILYASVRLLWRWWGMN